MLPLLLPPDLIQISEPPAQLQKLLSIPYVDDGVLDERGRWTSFTHPESDLRRPGLNCSGFVVAAARELLGCRLTLDQITRDRLQDSGEGAPLGRDWDFGWDLILNLSEGRPRRWLLPEGEVPVRPGDGRGFGGFHIQEAKAWAQILPRLKEDRVYLTSLRRSQDGRIRHHHVALVLKDAAGRAWFYQTLPRGRSHRLELSAAEGFARLCQMFGPGERVLLLEVESSSR